MACHVLIVDDEATVRDLYARVLEQAGCEVRTAGSTLEALEALAAQPAEVVVSDLLMPGLRGEILAEEVQTRFPAARVVIVSGWIGPRTRPALIERGVEIVLQKPLTSLRYLVDAVLSPVSLAQGMAS